MNATPLDMLDQYNVTWTDFAQTDRSSMPIGNGEVGVNLWVQRGGEIHFYFARTDARILRALMPVPRPIVA